MKLKSLILIILAAVMLFVSSCGYSDNVPPPSSSDTETDTASETTTAAESTTAETPIPPTGIDISEYRIIYKHLDSVAQRAANVLAEGLSSLSETKFAASSDMLLSDQDPTSDSIRNRFEIILGVTNRPESISETALKYNQYSINKVGSKIVILAGSQMMLTRARDGFLSLAKVYGGSVLCDIPDEGIIMTDENFGPYEIIVANQKTGNVEIYSLADGVLSSANALKSYTYNRAAGGDTRVRTYNGRTVVLTGYGSRFASIRDMETGEELFYVDYAPRTPHGIELLPGGIVGVAGTQEGEIGFFNMTDMSVECFKMPFDDAHGILYDPDLNVTWVVGRRALRAFEVSLDATGKPIVNERKDLAATIPSDYAHDLQPVKGDSDKLWITTSYGVYQYSKSEKKFVDYAAKSVLGSVKNVKSINSFADGSIIYIVPDGALEGWTSATIYMLLNVDGEFFKINITSTDGGYYKVRILDTSYQ